jgi:hypothetical protein
VNVFHNGREAKEFLISRIVLEAQRENLLLSEVERKMLYFTESGWTLPDIAAVSEDFGRDYDQSAYERKIAKLIRQAAKRDYKESREEYEAWWSAIRFLKKEDHYILVMIAIADLRPAGDRLRLFGTALGIVILFLFAIFLSIKYQIDPEKYLGSKDDRTFFFWLTGVGLVIAYFLFRFILGKKRSDKLVSQALETFVHLFRGTK